MTNPEWLSALGIAAAMVGANILANRKSIESMVGKRLDDLQESVKELMGTTMGHGEQLVRHQTVLEMHGLMDLSGGVSNLGRRRADRCPQPGCPHEIRMEDQP